jgi:hypothetical protein
VAGTFVVPPVAVRGFLEDYSMFRLIGFLIAAWPLFTWMRGRKKRQSA